LPDNVRFILNIGRSIPVLFYRWRGKW